MAATSTTSDNVAATTEGPLKIINNRLRSLEKKRQRIRRTENRGNTLNVYQKTLLDSKSLILCLIDELKILQTAARSTDAATTVITLINNRILTEESVTHGNIYLIDYLQKLREEVSPTLSPHPAPQPLNRTPEECEMASAAVVDDLVNLLYFGSLFDVMSQSDFTSLMSMRTNERECCLTHDYGIDRLGKSDLDVISGLKRLLISQPVDSTLSRLSHKVALQQCVKHAKLWIAKADARIPDWNLTYGGLREKLDKIMSSDYHTTTPKIKAAVSMIPDESVGQYKEMLHTIASASTGIISLHGCEYYKRSVINHGLKDVSFAYEKSHEEDCFKMSKLIASKFVLRGEFMLPGTKDRSEFLYESYDYNFSDYVVKFPLVEDEAEITKQSELTRGFKIILRDFLMAFKDARDKNLINRLVKADQVNNRGKVFGFNRHEQPDICFSRDHHRLAIIIKDAFKEKYKCSIIPHQLFHLLRFLRCGMVLSKIMRNIEFHPAFLGWEQGLHYRISAYCAIMKNGNNFDKFWKQDPDRRIHLWKYLAIRVPAFNSFINHQIQPNDENKLEYKDEPFSFLKFCRNLGAHLKEIVHTISFADAEMELQRIWPDFLPVLHQYLCKKGIYIFKFDQDGLVDDP